MKKLPVFIFLLIAGVMAFSQADGTSRRRYAFVLGNQHYKYAPLSSNISDATDIKKALEEKMFDVTFKKDLKSSEMKEAVQEFITKVNSDPHSVAFVYLSGHGYSSDGKNYFLPIDNDKIEKKDDVTDYAIDIEKDFASKVNSAGQIYAIDCAYDEPFADKVARGLTVKGGLASVRSSREKTVGFIFSTNPENVVQSKNSSYFAKALADEIESSTKNIDEVFADVRTKVISKTDGKQSPYSSATTLEFAFTGEELTALKKAAAESSADKTELARREMSRKYQLELAARKAALEAATAGAISASSAASFEIAEKRRLQQEEDARRIAEEQARAETRSAEATAQIMSLRLSFEENAESLKDSMKKNASAAERIDYIESLKSNLYEIRQTAQNQIENYNNEKDAQTQEKVAAINNAPWKKVEMSGGKPTAAALERRQKEAEKVQAEGETAKKEYKENKDAEVEVDNKDKLPKIKSAYSKLEGDTYVLTSISSNSLDSITDENLTVRVDDYDGDLGKWKLHISADLFGHADVFGDDIYLGYTEVTGKKTGDVAAMTSRQLEEYNEDVEVYDALFRSGTPVFYVKLYYKIKRWSGASEYHFIPKKCEIIRIGKKNKVIAKVKENQLQPAEFTQTPAVEIRTEKEIKADIKSSAKIKIAEEKARGTYDAPVKAAESAEKSSALKASEKSASDYSRTGRNTFYVSVSRGNTDLSKLAVFNNYNYDNPYFYSVEGHLTFSLAKYYYMGFAGGLIKYNYKDIYDNCSSEAKSDMDKNCFYGKYVNGLTFPIGNHVRLFGEGGIVFSSGPYNFITYDEFPLPLGDAKNPGTDKALGFCAGGGIDVILTKHFMITAGANYNWMHYLKSFKYGAVKFDKNDGKYEIKNGFLQALESPDFHYTDFSIGFGWTW